MFVRARYAFATGFTAPFRLIFSVVEVLADGAVRRGDPRRVFARRGLRIGNLLRWANSAFGTASFVGEEPRFAAMASTVGAELAELAARALGRAVLGGDFAGQAWLACGIPL